MECNDTHAKIESAREQIALLNVRLTDPSLNQAERARLQAVIQELEQDIAIAHESLSQDAVASLLARDVEQSCPATVADRSASCTSMGTTASVISASASASASATPVHTTVKPTAMVVATPTLPCKVCNKLLTAATAFHLLNAHFCSMAHLTQWKEKVDPMRDAKIAEEQGQETRWRHVNSGGSV